MAGRTGPGRGVVVLGRELGAFGMSPEGAGVAEVGVGGFSDGLGADRAGVPGRARVGVDVTGEEE